MSIVAVCNNCLTQVKGSLESGELRISPNNRRCPCILNLRKQGWIHCCGSFHNPKSLQTHRKSGTCSRWCKDCKTEVRDFGRHECPRKDNMLGTCSSCRKLCFNVVHTYCNHSEHTIFMCACGEKVPLKNPFPHWEMCKYFRQWPDRMAPLNKLKEHMVDWNQLFKKEEDISEDYMRFRKRILEGEQTLGTVPPEWNWFHSLCALNIAITPASAKNGQPFYPNPTFTPLPKKKAKKQKLLMAVAAMIRKDLKRDNEIWMKIRKSATKAEEKKRERMRSIRQKMRN